MRLSYVSPTGESFDLIGGGFSDDVFVEQDTLSGFVGAVEYTALNLVGRQGQYIIPRDQVVKPITGSFTVVVKSVQAWGRFRRALRSTAAAGYPFYSQVSYGKLLLGTDVGQYQLPVRVSKIPDGPARRVRAGMRIPIQFISDGGVWEQWFSATGRVEVFNSGDVPVRSVLRWQGAGGRVVLPSGAGFSLPAVRTSHVFVDGRVYGKDGVDVSLTRQVAGVSEQIPVGDTGVFQLPEGVWLDYRIGVFDPWV